jgi:hypothetical protein
MLLFFPFSIFDYVDMEVLLCLSLEGMRMLMVYCWLVSTGSLEIIIFPTNMATSF